MKYNLELLPILILLTSCLIRSSNGFSMSIFGSTDIWPGSTALIQWHGGARNVNVMLAVQNKDTTLSPVGQTTFNVAPYGSTIIRVNSGTPTGRNYFFIAEDIIDPSNYTSVGPFSIIEPFGDAHPTNSITVSATERFITDSIPTSTLQGTGASASVRSKSTNTANTDSNNDNDNGTESPAHFILSVVQIIGIVVGCVGAVIVGAIIYVCCFKRSKATPDIPLYPPAPMNINGPSRMSGVPIAMTNPTVKTQSLKKPVVGKVDSNMTVVGSVYSPKLQENTTTNLSNDLSYTQNLANQSPPSMNPPQQGYPYYGNNELHYGNQMQYPYPDTMPMSTYFTNSSSPTPPSLAYMQQQQMYPSQNQAYAANYWDYHSSPPPPLNFSPKPDTNNVDNKTEQIPMVSSSTTTTTQKTEIATAPAKTEQAKSSLSQKFEMPVVHADLEQQHDSTSLFQKPHDPSYSS